MFPRGLVGGDEGMIRSDCECDSVFDGLLCWESCDPSWPITPLSVLRELTLLRCLRTFRGLCFIACARA